MLRAAGRARMLPGQQNSPRREEGFGPYDVELVISSDGEIAALNARRLGCTGPTNVLSFPAGGVRLGSLFLSSVTMEREIFLYGQKPAEHARRLLAHGFGHISGFDHGPAMDAFCTMLEDACRLECS
ncbi:MAG: rRNA maturation RNAse YbeY [Mailhella sp.]|nr:rRNA maturation RNAse YbeY [Mailhella sp.]